METRSRNTLVSWLFPCTNPAVQGGGVDEGRVGNAPLLEADDEGSLVWRTFFEIVDDTAQIAKSHAAYSENLLSQLVEPLKNSLRQMEAERKATVGEGQHAAQELESSGNALLKARSRYDSCALEAVRLKDAVSLANSAALRNNNPADVNKEKMLLHKAKKAEEMALSTRKALRAAEETHRQTHSRHHATDLPRVMTVSIFLYLARPPKGPSNGPPITVYRCEKMSHRRLFKHLDLVSKTRTRLCATLIIKLQ